MDLKGNMWKINCGPIKTESKTHSLSVVAFIAYRRLRKPVQTPNKQCMSQLRLIKFGRSQREVLLLFSSNIQIVFDP